MKANANPTCKCGKMFKRYTSFQDKCLECTVAKVQKERVRDDRKADKAKKKASWAYKKKVQLNDVEYQHGLTKPQFNKMRVLEEKIWFAERGIEPYCISCQRTKMDFCCGHYMSVGAQSGLRYDRMNTYIQCNWRCNSNLSGNINGDKTSIGYTAGILLRFGDKEGLKIIDYCESHTQPVKWDCEWLQEFRLECRAKIRELERQLQSMCYTGA